MENYEASRQQLSEEVTNLRATSEELMRVKPLGHPDSEPKFHALAEITTAAIFIFQGQRNRYVNPATEAITGYSEEELLAMNFWDILHPDFRDLVKTQGLARQQGLAVPTHYEVKIVTKGGEIRWLDYTGGLIEFEGQPAVLGTAFDITERKLAEKEIAQLYEQVRRELVRRREVELEIIQRNAELLALQYAAATLASSLDLPFILNTLGHELTTLLSVTGCLICQWDRATDAIKVIARYGLAHWKDEWPLIYPLSNLVLSRRVLTERRAFQLTLNQADADPAEVVYMQAIKVKSLLMLPMEFQGQVVGLIEVMDDRLERSFDNQEIAMAQMLANQAASAVQNAQLYAEVIQRLKEQTALREASMVISSTLELDTVLHHIAEQMGRAVGASSAYICDYQSATMTSTVVAEYFSPEASAEERVSDLGVTYPLPRDFSLGFDRLLANQSEEIHLDELEENGSRWQHMRQYGAKTILNIPLRYRGQIIAFAELWESRHKRHFTLEELALCQGIAQQAAIALEHARLYAQAQREIKERSKIEAELRGSETRQRALLDAIPDMIFRLTRTGTFLDYRCGTESSSIWPAQVEIGQNLAGVFPAEIAALIRERLEQVLASGAPQTFEFRRSMPYYSQDYEARLVASEAGEVLGIVRNVTERKQLEEQAMRSERLAALGQLSAALTHEINNPLQSMQTHLDLLLDFSLEPGEDKKFLHVIRQEIERLNQITRRVLNLARPWPVLRRKVFVTDLLQEVLLLVNKQLKQSQIEPITDWQDVAPVLAVPDQLTQVFLNLIINAIEATPPGGQLRITVRPLPNQVTVSIINSGSIIAPDVLPYIFEPFFTTKLEGSGLGLWVSHNLIRQHGGSISVDNLGSNEGVAFTINLPTLSAMEVIDDGAYLPA